MPTERGISPVCTKSPGQSQLITQGAFLFKASLGPDQSDSLKTLNSLTLTQHLFGGGHV